MKLELTMFNTTAIAILILFLGSYVKSKIEILRKFCIPIPVVGGLIFTIFTLIGYTTNIFSIKFDFTLSDFFMLAFYTSIGFTASISLLKKGGIKTVKLLIVSSILVVLQNGIGVIICKILGINPLIGLATGSIPMTGGHGTSAVFAVPLENLTGGPLGRYLVEKSIKNSKVSHNQKVNTNINKETENKLSAKGFEQAIFLLLLAMALGTIISMLLGKTGLTFPASVGGMLASAFIVNIKNFNKLYPIKYSEIHIFGEISLAIFLSMSMMKLKLWQIIDLAGPMLILLFAQVILIIIFIIFVAFPVMGKDYEAAVTCSGFCGYGLGAVPTGVANMDTLTEKYYPAPESFFIVPLVGSLFINIVNTFIITFFMNVV